VKKNTGSDINNDGYIDSDVIARKNKDTKRSIQIPRTFTMDQIARLSNSNSNIEDDIIYDAKDDNDNGHVNVDNSPRGERSEISSPGGERPDSPGGLSRKTTAVKFRSTSTGVGE